jgi:RNA recognition motif-containing protein
MASLWIGNIPPNTSDEELKALLAKYGFPACDEIKHVPGDGSRPAAILSFNSASPLTLHQLQPRVQNLFWKDRRLTVSVMSTSS